MPLLTGRATHVQWVQRPVKLNSATTIVGLQLKDPQAFKPVLEKIVQKHADYLEKQRYGDFTYWSLKGERVGFFPWKWIEVRLLDELRKKGLDLRQRLSCMGIVNDYLLMTDSMEAYQEAIAALQKPENSLATSLDFKLIASKVRRQPGGDAPATLMFQRPDEGLRLIYDLATADSTKKGLSDRGSRNQFLGSLDQALKDHPLPPFEVLAEYMAPGGGVIVNDETGIHYTTFTLKRK